MNNIQFILFDCTGMVQVICDTVLLLGVMAMGTVWGWVLFGRGR